MVFCYNRSMEDQLVNETKKMLNEITGIFEAIDESDQDDNGYDDEVLLKIERKKGIKKEGYLEKNMEQKWLELLRKNIALT